ncbi:MAG: aminopeptidase P family protein [Actinobacteria bacterium]|nr:aminopeptidase P family protein [Actinomycetota bacterium]
MPEQAAQSAPPTALQAEQATPPTAPRAAQSAPPTAPPAEQSTPLDELLPRLAALRESLLDEGHDGALILQNADLYYYAGTVQQSFLYVPSHGEPLLLVRRVVERARRESALPAIVELPSLRRLPALIAEHCGRSPARLGLELDVLPVRHLRRLESLFPHVVMSDVSPAILRRRAVKSAYEVSLIRAAAALTDAVFARLPGLLEEGLTEVAFAGRCEALARELGHEGVIRMRGFNQEMFYGQLVSGVNGTVPSFLDTPLAGAGLSPAVAQGVTTRRIARGEPVVFDFVSSRAGYIADFTRVLSLGPLPDVCRRVFAAALEIETAVADAARPGASCRMLYELALARAAAAGLAGSFMGQGRHRARFVGHGVGLELDELPVLAANDDRLAAGMVFALEPKFVLPGIGAVGIEDTFVVTPDGGECLFATERRLFELSL